MSLPDGEQLTTAYEILVHGKVDERTAGDIGARSFEPCPGRTLLVVDMIDQSHLHGVLEQLRDLNIVIERFNPV